MSAVPAPAIPGVEQPIATPAVPETKPEETTATAPITSAEEAVKPTDEVAAPAETAATAAAAVPAEEKKDEVAPAEKVVEPLSEGILGYKAPGLLKQLTWSKHSFWLSDEQVAPANLDLFLRGEKPDFAHPIVAWASQTGKGLLFFNKKGDSDRSHPHDVLPLYDATEVTKVGSHEFAFHIAGHKHTFKAASETERDGWYISVEKAVELGKAGKETTVESEGYKAELEKLTQWLTLSLKKDTPSTKVAGVAGAARSRSRPQQEPETAAESKRTGSSDGEEDEKKKQKSRSTSRGMFNRLKGKKDEVEQKREEKKEEKKEQKEEQKAEEEIKKESEVAPEVAATAGATAVAGGAAAATTAGAEPSAGEHTTDTQHGKNIITDRPAEPSTEEKKEIEQQKPQKRASIFGRMSSGFGSLKSPSKEKSAKDAELKLDTPAKEHIVSENPPQLPETSVTEPTEPAPADITATEPTAAEEVPATKDASASPTTAGKEKNFLGGFGTFINKRRSVSPSANLKEAPTPATKTEAPVEGEAAEAAKLEETIAAAPITATEIAPTPVVASGASTEEAKPAEETAATATTTPPQSKEKRGSVLTNLSRRASKAFKGFGNPAQKEKETTSPAATTGTEAAKEPEAEGAAAATTSTETPAVTSEEAKAEQEIERQQIGGAVPEDLDAPATRQQPTPAVTASA
ncbi:hypothetical protein K431DRAFT_293241 [Polychaeton citri CBS 116435]|uniref:PH domain-containing protein n=1 Tax=Polychaeton citri CBS 116435 TaxID=1314669 RepID=A0A9P4QAI1_9PEZI|nr:hypothetical protein K431DRAFT_293241 [Polychaeton citri CBS 116435]